LQDPPLAARAGSGRAPSLTFDTGARLARVLAVLALLACAFAAAVVDGPPARAADSSDWVAFQGDAAHLGSTTAAPAPPLRSAWRWPAAGTNGVPAGPASPSPESTRLGTVAARFSASAPVVAGDVAVVLTATQVIGLDPATGTERWRLARASGYLDMPAVDTSATPPLLVYAEGRLGATSAVVAMDLDKRSQVWRYPATGGLKQPLRGAPVIDSGTVYVGSDDGNVYALDEKTGAKRWAFQTGARVQTSPAVAGGAVFVIADNSSSGQSTLFALDAATGKLRWNYSPRGVALNSSPPTVAGDRVFVGFGDRTVKAVDAASGAVLWSSPVRFPFSPFNGLAYASGSVYALDAAGGLYRFDATTGDHRWDFQFDATALRSAPLVAGSVVYVGLDDGMVAAVDVATGDRVSATTVAAGGAGALAPAAGDVLIAQYVGDGGGVIAFRHGPGGLTAVESPTKLHPGIALVNFLVAAVAVTGVVLAVFAVLARRRRREGRPSAQVPVVDAS
jgi:serine/threonine-protein kinase